MLINVLTKIKANTRNAYNTIKATKSFIAFNS